MVKTIKARYSRGMIEPLEPVEMEEGQEVFVTLTPRSYQQQEDNPTLATAIRRPHVPGVGVEDAAPKDTGRARTGARRIYLRTA
jgi:predicted DNA-binding antitoxin AbrB/MazE fold protein